MTLLSIFHDYVVVPRRFIRNHPHVIDAAEVVLSDPNGNTYHVEVRVEPNEVRFEGGFETIRETHSCLALPSYCSVLFGEPTSMSAYFIMMLWKLIIQNLIKHLLRMKYFCGLHTSPHHYAGVINHW